MDFAGGYGDFAQAAVGVAEAVAQDVANAIEAQNGYGQGFSIDVTSSAPDTLGGTAGQDGGAAVGGDMMQYTAIYTGGGITFYNASGQAVYFQQDYYTNNGT